MRNVVFIGSHLGYPMDRTPLGGGGMVGLQLVRHWAGLGGAPSRGKSGDFRLTVLGSGAHDPTPERPGVSYLQLPSRPGSPDLVRLSEMGYARFCRRFEAATTAYLLDNPRIFEPRRTAVIVNDISESPDLDRLAGAGYRILSIWHVDVVDFFNRLYLGGLLAPERWTRAFARIERWGLARCVPDVLRLVFQKQRRVVERSAVLALPSRRMAETIRRCYGGRDGGRPTERNREEVPPPDDVGGRPTERNREEVPPPDDVGGRPTERNREEVPPPDDVGGRPLEERILIAPWGGWRESFSEEAVALEASRLRAHYHLRPGSRVVLTLSRISPEKGIHLLLEALRRLEGSPRFRATDVCLFICGETAFMRGESYGRRVRAAAERLRRFRVFFPGYLAPVEKQAYFRLADLFVSPSLHESYGLTIVEAMRAGLPILASDHYGGDEILDPSYGRTVPYGDAGLRPRLLAVGLEEMLGDPAGLRRMGRRAREASASARMDFAGTARRLLDAALALIPEES
ncbi:MAG: glycosyltransferase family 4 protein [Elusimicrobiota bacterium]